MYLFLCLFVLLLLVSFSVLYYVKWCFVGIMRRLLSVFLFLLIWVLSRFTRGRSSAASDVSTRQAARARINRFLNARCSTYTTTPHFLSMKAQKCDPTCTSPATGRSGTPSGPGNTTRQIRTLHRGGHVPKAPPVRTLTGRTHRSCMRAPPAPLTCPAAPNDCCHSV